MSFLMIWDLMLLTLEVASLSFSSSSASWSCSGWMTSSVIFCCSTNCCWQACDSFRQCSYSLFMDSMSSLTKSMLLPRGLVLWQRTWIAFFMNSISCSEKPLPTEPFSIALENSGAATFLATTFSSPGALGAAGPPFLAFLPILFILIFGPALSAFLLASSSSSCMSRLASSTRAPPLPSISDCWSICAKAVGCSSSSCCISPSLMTFCCIFCCCCWSSSACICI
mmetsp:Transcript_16569/g.28198  ORF Transcript_16569/g.28198 Transcript_16569/m.28198 type:complete len:225 (+) Transcript_16569:101-775(+)